MMAQASLVDVPPDVRKKLPVTGPGVVMVPKLSNVPPLTLMPLALISCSSMVLLLIKVPVLNIPFRSTSSLPTMMLPLLVTVPEFLIPWPSLPLPFVAIISMVPVLLTRSVPALSIPSHSKVVRLREPLTLRALLAEISTQQMSATTAAPSITTELGTSMMTFSPAAGTLPSDQLEATFQPPVPPSHSFSVWAARAVDIKRSTKRYRCLIIVGFCVMMGQI